MTAPAGPSTRDGIPPLKLLVLQPTPFCNIDCKYCYLPERTARHRMSLRTLEQVCRRILHQGAPAVDIAWHAGEPLTVDLQWYEDAFALIDGQSPPGVDLTHCFQTNGLLLDRRWLDFFARNGAKVGLSIDGPEDLHDRNRRTRAGGGTFRRVMDAVHLLQEADHPFHVITVLTDASLDQPDRLFDFYVSHGIRNVGFNVEEVEGEHRSSSLTGAAVETRFRRFLRRFFDRVLESGGAVRVREFEDAVVSVLSPDMIKDQQNEPFCIVSVSWDGVVTTFSPELLGSSHPRFGRFAFGHIDLDDLASVARSSLFREVASEIRRGVESCERECAYFRWCGGGAPANKLFETGRFDTTETMHCRLTRKAVLDVVVDGIRARAGAGRVEDMWVGHSRDRSEAGRGAAP